MLSVLPWQTDLLRHCH